MVVFEYLREVFSLNEMVIPKTLKIFEFKEPEHTFQNLELLPFGSDTVYAVQLFWQKSMIIAKIKIVNAFFYIIIKFAFI